MKARLRNIWEALHTSFWFVPSLMALGAIFLALILLGADEHIDSEAARQIAGVYRGGPEGALQLLSTLAGSMMTVTGITFSITIVALTLASSQFGPRLLRNFMQDTGNQVVLGTFIATFLFCLIVLQAVSAKEATEFVPRLSITAAIAFATLSMGVLIFFIHHVASSIQAENVISLLSTELQSSIKHMYPEHLGEPPHPGSARDLPDTFDTEAALIGAKHEGYFKAIDGDALMDLATRNDILVEVLYRPGKYLIAGVPLFKVFPAANLTVSAKNELLGTMVAGKQRTRHQDIEFPIDQLVEIAVRALSPGINDPFSAISCVDRLGASLSLLAQRDIPSRFRRDTAGNLRVIVHRTDFVGALDAALNQIRQNATDSPAVLIRLLERLGDIARFVQREEDRGAIVRHAVLILSESEKGELGAHDLADIRTRYDQVMRRINNNGA